jgi:hypothetical protein
MVMIRMLITNTNIIITTTTIIIVVVDLIPEFLVNEEGSEFNPTDVRTYSGMQMGPKQAITYAAMYGYDTRKKLSFSLGKHTTIQTINAYAAPNMDIGYKNRNSYTLNRQLNCNTMTN